MSSGVNKAADEYSNVTKPTINGIERNRFNSREEWINSIILLLESLQPFRLDPPPSRCTISLETLNGHIEQHRSIEHAIETFDEGELKELKQRVAIVSTKKNLSKEETEEIENALLGLKQLDRVVKLLAARDVELDLVRFRLECVSSFFSPRSSTDQCHSSWM
jgi:hypothetical protein